ncbi:hypothetical protein [Microvirga calopogonii]|uniref:hypothetical protein n=1 Tax=Microvirga calopogonii TaxID=2078013 RepID=UPI000E0D0D56|nr:hypothetical protein [Microvirga calopogonii]
MGLWLGASWGIASGVILAIAVEHSLWLGRNFVVWTASSFLVWSFSVQMSADFLPLHDEFWRVLVTVWNANGIIGWSLGIPLVAGPLAWLVLGIPASAGLDALFKRVRRDHLEGPLLGASATIFALNWSAPATPSAALISITIFAGIIGMVMDFFRRKLARSAATLDDKIEALEMKQGRTQVRDINILALGQAGRPKRFVFDDDEGGGDEAEQTPPVLYPNSAAAALPLRQEAPIEEPIDLTPDASLWDEDGGDQAAAETAMNEDEGQHPEESEIPQDFVFDESLFASDNSLGDEAEPRGEETMEDLTFEAGATVDEEARRIAFMDARKLVDAYHLLSEQAATSDDPVSVREAVGTLADMITNTTQLSRDCLAEIDHPDVIDGWIFSATLDEDADIEREIYDHFMSPAVEAVGTDEFSTPVLDAVDEPTPQAQRGIGSAPEWAMGTTIVMEASEAVGTQTQEPETNSALDEAVPLDEGPVPSTMADKPAIATPLLEGDLTEDEKSLLVSILEDQDLLENGLRAIAGYDFRPKALSLLSGRVGALIRARWSEVVGDLRLQRFFMTVLERADEELYERVGLRRSVSSVRFTTSLVQEETETFLMEVQQKLQSGIETKEDYDFLLGCRDRLESLTEAFGEVVPSLNDLAERFRKDLDASGRVYGEPLTPVVTELTGVHAIDISSIKRGMGHVLASGLDQNNRDLLDGFIAVAKSVKTLDQQVKMEAMRRQTDVSTHPLFDSVMALKQEALARAKALQDRVMLSGGGETRLKNMLLSGGEDAAEVFTQILGSAQEVENYRVDGKSKSALLASLESQMAALNRLNEEHAVEKRELRKQADANLTSDSIESHIGLLAEVFSAKKNAGNHKMVTDAETVLTRPKTGPVQAIYRTKDVTYAFCFVYGQNRNDWYIKDAEMLLCRSNSTAISLKQARAQVGSLAEVQTDRVRMRFIMVHGNVEAGMGIAFSAKQALEHPDLLLKASELDRGLEKLAADEQEVRPAA